MALEWTTPAGFLFTTTIHDVVAEDIVASEALSYEIISGNLPEGLVLTSQGQITGTIDYIENSKVSTFVVRASSESTVRDRTFYINVVKQEGTDWSTDGFTVDGSTLKKLLINKDYVDFQLNANIDHPVTYYIDRTTGRLPFGMTMNASGKISGAPNIVLAPSQALEYSFDVIAADDVKEYRQSIIISVIDSNSFTVDNANFTLGNDTEVSLIDLGNTGTVSLSSLQAPEFLRNSYLGEAIAGTKQYLNVTAFDPNPGKGPVTYSSVGALPAGLILDQGLGYLYGQLSPQADYLHDYSFNIVATKQDIVTDAVVVNTGTFNFKVVNQWYNNVIWPSSNLGTIIEGIPSDVTVAASQYDATYPLNYYLVPYSNLPEGLSLSEHTGNIIGSATTGGNYTFTIAASTASYAGIEAQLVWPVVSHPVSYKTFKLNVKEVDKEYTSIWAKPFLIPTQRALWESFISDNTIFLPDVIYRPDDPSFGVQQDLRIFLEFGIEKINLRDYASSLYQNLYMRRLTFGNVKSAIAEDKSGNHIYDAIYVDVVDTLEESKTVISINGTTYHPGSIDNIRNNLEAILLDNNAHIAIDSSHLPKFMTTVAGTQPYGYFKSAILCYTLPGQSNKIINRIRASKFNFDNLDFFIDRLIVQNSLDNTGTSYISFNSQPIG